MKRDIENWAGGREQTRPVFRFSFFTVTGRSKYLPNINKPQYYNKTKLFKII
jgi:hypothetical protein